MWPGWLWLLMGSLAWFAVSCGPQGAPNPKFTVNPAEGVAPLTVLCQNQTPQRYPLGLFAVKWRWEFGDGTPDSTETGPLHTFEQPGEYTVRLTASTPLGSRSAEQTVRVFAPDESDDGGDGGDGGGGDGGGGDGGGGTQEVQPSFTRAFSVSACSPGLPVDITLTLEYSGTASITALGLVETLPPDWVFEGIVSGTVDNARQNGRDLEFAWISIPAFPVSLTYRVRAPADLSGNQVFSGTLFYRFDAGSLSYGPVIGELPATTGNGSTGTDASAMLIRKFSTDGVYTPGEPVTVVLTAAYTGIFPLSSIGIRETLPPGWTLGNVSGDCAPPVFRQNGQDAEFAWIDIPPLPCSFTYQVWPPPDASGQAGFTGTILFRTIATELTSGPFVGTLYPAAPTDPSDPRVTVPSVTGLDLDAASAALAGSGLVQGDVFWEHRTDTPADRVAAQFPPAGASVLPGSAVLLTVSLGPPANPETDYAAETVVNLRRSPLVAFEPGGTVSISVSFDKRGGRQVSTLTLQETLPEGWTFSGMESGGDPGVQPEIGASGTLVFSWTAPETFPFTAVYRISPPAQVNGIPAISGTVQYQFADGSVGAGIPAESRLVPLGGLDTMVAAQLSAISPECFTPGEDQQITITLSRAGGTALSALGAVLTLPEGWIWGGILNGSAPPIIRADGSAVEFAWITPPALPLTFTARITAPAAVSEDRAVFSCQAQGRLAAGGALYGPVDGLAVPRRIAP